MEIQRYDLVGEYDLSIGPIDGGDYVKFEDVEEVIAQKERYRLLVLKMRDIIMIGGKLTEDENKVLKEAVVEVISETV